MSADCNTNQENQYQKHHTKEDIFNEHEILAFLQLKKNYKILDAGCGDGFFSKIFIKISHDITCIDTNSSFFPQLNKIGVKTIKADICNFTEGLYDLIFLANVFHELSCQTSVLKNLYTMSREYVAILDFKSNTPFGPPKNVRVQKSTLISTFLNTRMFKVARVKDLKYHYIVLFEVAN